MLVIRSLRELKDYLVSCKNNALRQKCYTSVALAHRKGLVYGFEESIDAVQVYIDYLESTCSNIRTKKSAKLGETAVDSCFPIPYNEDRDEYELGGEG